jgi:metallophosphoesterase superfamily enzyme
MEESWLDERCEDKQKAILPAFGNFCSTALVSLKRYRGKGEMLVLTRYPDTWPVQE